MFLELTRYSIVENTPVIVNMDQVQLIEQDDSCTHLVLRRELDSDDDVYVSVVETAGEILGRLSLGG